MPLDWRLMAVGGNGGVGGIYERGEAAGRQSAPERRWEFEPRIKQVIFSKFRSIPTY